MVAFNGLARSQVKAGNLAFTERERGQEEDLKSSDRGKLFMRSRLSSAIRTVSLQNYALHELGLAKPPQDAYHP